MNKNFAQIVVLDFEYEAEGGEHELKLGDLPEPLCMVAYDLDGHLHHMRTIKMWRHELLASTEPPFDTGPDTVVVAYSAWAEMTCFLKLGWRFPVYVLDLHTAYLAASNILLPYNPNEVRKKPRKRLPDACRAYGIEGWESIDKGMIAQDIGEGRWQKHGRDAVTDYCEEDVRNTVKLLRAMLQGRPRFPRIDVQRVLYWSNYSAKCCTQIQARGMPIDMALWNLVQEHKAAVIRELVLQFDPSQGDDDPIYTLEGEWSYARFERWLAKRGVIAWPRLDSGQLDISGDAFRLMFHVPGIEGLYALRESLRVIATAKLPIGRDGRNRPSLFPFGTATGRNAHCRSLYNTHAAMRSFMVFPPDRIGVYLDWRTQEVAVAAARSNDPALLAAYREGDVYYAFARDAGLTNDRDRKHWAKHDQPMRQRMKVLQLGINYGMGVPALAKGLNRHPLIASNLIEQHRRMYEVMWQWRDEQMKIAMLERRMESLSGWPLHIISSPNKRTLYNFPMQSGGSEMLRLATGWLCEAGLVPCMLIHDGILLELENREQIGQAVEIMRKAGMETCDGLEVGVDVDQQLEDGARYCDKRPIAQMMWDALMRVLENVKAIPRRA